MASSSSGQPGESIAIVAYSVLQDSAWPLQELLHPTGDALAIGPKVTDQHFA